SFHRAGRDLDRGRRRHGSDHRRLVHAARRLKSGRPCAESRDAGESAMLPVPAVWIEMMRFSLLTPLFAMGVALAACQTPTASTPPAPPPEQAAPGVTPSTFRMPSGASCSGEVERFQAVMDNDLATGHTTKGVH